MRRTAISFVAGSILASMVLLLLFDVTPKLKSPTNTQERIAATEISPQREERTEAESAPPMPDSEPSEPQLASREASENINEVLEPIATPPEFDFVSRDQVFWHEDRRRELHAKLEREPRDPDWSYVSESTLSSVVNARPEITTYGTPAIQCRSETCQIQLLAYGGDGIDEGEWSTRFGAVYKEVSDSFELEDFSVAQEGGWTAMVLHLSRKDLPR